MSRKRHAMATVRTTRSVVPAVLAVAALLAGCGSQPDASAPAVPLGAMTGTVTEPSTAPVAKTAAATQSSEPAPSQSGDQPSTGTPVRRGPIPLALAQRLPRRPVWQPNRGGGSEPWPRTWTQPVEFPPTQDGPLSGVTVAIDPGHNSGASGHISEINRTYWVGLTKVCNTTGTGTTGLAESAYTFDVARRLATNLVNDGATVLFTRGSDSDGKYGPCIGGRGAFGAQEGADFKISIHADGVPGSKRGFHVIVPGGLAGYTDDIARPSRKLARDVVSAFTAAGFSPAQYLSSPYSVRNDQGTLNMSDIPTVIVETLNMQNSDDARLARSRAGRQQVADALTDAAVRYGTR